MKFNKINFSVPFCKDKKIQKYSYFTILAIATFFITSCSLKVENKGVSHQVWIPWPTADGQYKMQKVQVDSITKWSPIRGSAAKIRSHYTELNEKQASSSEVIMDYTTDSSGAVVPMTQFSVEVASIYANFDRLQKLDQRLELENSNEPRSVYVKLKLEVEPGEILTNNAFYNFLTDSFYVVPYTEPGLPLSVNGAVLAHEHFHSIYGRLVQKPLYDYGQTKNIDLFDDYAIHNDSLFKKEFKQSFVTHAQHMQKSSSTSQIAGNSKITADTNPKSVTGTVMGDSEAFATFHLNKVFFMALNEGLADVWAWLYSNQACFIAPSLDLNASLPMPEDLWSWLDENYIASGNEGRSGSRSGNGNSRSALSSFLNAAKLDNHDNRCLSLPDGEQLIKKSVASIINKSKFATFHTKMKIVAKEDLLAIEKKVVSIMGYRLGTNLARLFYQRLAERGDNLDSTAQFQWAKHIKNTLPQLVSQMKTVYIDELRVKSLFSWDSAVDLLLFGEGTPDVPKEKCQAWIKIFNGDVLQENFKKKCSL